MKETMMELIKEGYYRIHYVGKQVLTCKPGCSNSDKVEAELQEQVGEDKIDEVLDRLPRKYIL